MNDELEDWRKIAQMALLLIIAASSVIGTADRFTGSEARALITEYCDHLRDEGRQRPFCVGMSIAPRLRVPAE